jgi:glucose-1-phosphate adenylyltransferase
VLFSDVRVHSFCSIQDSVVLPNVEIQRNCVLKRVVIDRFCRLPEGTQIGVDPEADRRRFHMTDRGVTLVTPDMLGTPVHHLR